MSKVSYEQLMKMPAVQEAFLEEDILNTFRAWRNCPDAEAFFGEIVPVEILEHNLKQVSVWFHANVAPASRMLQSAWELALCNCEHLIPDSTWMPRQERFKALEASLSVAALKSLMSGDTSQLSEKQMAWLEILGGVSEFIHLYQGGF